MRDPRRIDLIMDDLHALWELEPDLRLGQLMTILAACDDLFYIEDDELRMRMYIRHVEIEDRLAGKRTSGRIRPKSKRPWYCPPWFNRGAAAEDPDTELDG